MPDREKVVKGIEICVRSFSNCNACPYNESNGMECIDNLRRDVIELMRAQEPDYPVCEQCGKRIDYINTSVFDYDGGDSEHRIPLYFDKPNGCVIFETTKNWTGYELTDEERKEGIRCPHCGKYPFDKGCEIEFIEPVHVLMWTSRPTEEQGEATLWI